MKIAAPEKHGFDGSRLRAIDTFLKERYLDSGEFPHAQLLVQIHDEAHLHPFMLRHEPVADAGRHVIAGHLHPQVALPPLRRRFPVFWLRDGMTVLPAFSAFTAGIVPVPAPGEQRVACVEGSLVELPVT